MKPLPMLLGVTLALLSFGTVQVSSLTNEDLELITEIQQLFREQHKQYQSLVESTRRETSSIVRSYNAQILSRAGFTVEDVVAIKTEVEIEIGERAYIVGNAQPCILEADRLLREASVRAGEEVANSTAFIAEVIRDLQTSYIFRFTDQMQSLASLMQTEVLFLFGRLNSVNNIEEIIEILLWEASFTDYLFEISVDQLIYEMRRWSLGMNNVKIEVFPILSDTLDNYRTTGNEIRASLAQCN